MRSQTGGEFVDPTAPSGFRVGASSDPHEPGAADPMDGPAAPARDDEDGPTALGGDVARIPIHRLNNTEYDNTMRDLLGVSSTPARGFIADEKALGFDTIASAHGMTDAQFEQYWNAADALVTEVFADAKLRDRIMLCGDPDPSCTSDILSTFGLRAFRRPLRDDELARLSSLQAEAARLGEDFPGSIALVVRAMLSSADFLYRVELDSDPSSDEAHPLGPYELASRLSYLVWSSMPDAELFDAAESGELSQRAGLHAQLVRMLQSPRAGQLVENFAGQWLGVRDLRSHQVETSVLPRFNETLRESMMEEGLAYFGEFLSGGRDVDEFFTADVNFVDAELAELYGIPAPAGTASGSGRVSIADDERRGFLGLAGFLTTTSFSYRTAPTLRGKWVLENLLCEEIPPPPPNVPVLDDANADDSDLQSDNVRVRLEAHRKNPSCAACHRLLDPIGLGLENFDAIGAYRTTYGNGDAVDASGELPDGTPFSGLLELTEALSTDARFGDCVSEKLLTYALSRELTASDEPYLAQLRQEWEASDHSIGALLEGIVQSDIFRFRRGEP